MEIVPEASAPDLVSLAHQPHDIHSICRVDFERPLRKGEEKELKYALRMQDTHRAPEQFHIHSIYYRTDRLIIRVRLEQPHSDLRFYRRQILASSTADMPIYEDG